VYGIRLDHISGEMYIERPVDELTFVSRAAGGTGEPGTANDRVGRETAAGQELRGKP
jgi:hypothetical protein